MRCLDSLLKYNLKKGKKQHLNVNQFIKYAFKHSRKTQILQYIAASDMKKYNICDGENG